jgi:hypothetical protein
MLDLPSGHAAAPDLADHFVQCCKLGRYLTVFDGSRFVISDDFRAGQTVDPIATAVASIYSTDMLVAQAAVVPLGLMARGIDLGRKEKFEELFSLIEERALTGEVRDSAQAILASGFQDAKIKAIEAELGVRISPARLRYRAFLDVVRKLIDKRVSAPAFRDEFLEFTYAVAGRLDFGIYSFCIDRMFANQLIPLKVKALLVDEIIKYRPLIRRELLSNILAVPNQDADLVQSIRSLVSMRLPPEVATEIYLLEALKLSRVSADELERSLVGQRMAHLRPSPGISVA